jgi:hypothetical protein
LGKHSDGTLARYDVFTTIIEAISGAWRITVPRDARGRGGYEASTPMGFLSPPWFLVLVPLVIIGPWQVIGDIGTLLFSFVVPFLGCWEEWEGATSFLPEECRCSNFWGIQMSLGMVVDGLKVSYSMMLMGYAEPQQ